MRRTPLTVGGADLRGAFYYLGLPVGLRDLFTMLSAGALGLKTLKNGQELRAPVWVVPRVCVAPMGWAWALWWMQRIHERASLRSGVGEAWLAAGGAPALDAHAGAQRLH